MLRYSVLLLGFAAVSFAASPAKILLVAGTPSHAPGAHEFNAGILLLEGFLKQNPGVQPVVVKGGWPADETIFEGARTLVFFLDGGAHHPMIQGDRLATIGRLMKQGVGLACLHYAVEIPKDHGGPEFLDWIGGYYETGYSTNPHNDVVLTPASPDHPISRGWKAFEANDEWYYKIRFRPSDSRLQPILTTMLPKENPQREVVAWAIEREDGGRGFGFTGVHVHRNWGIESFRRLIVNAVLWTAKFDIPNTGARCDLDPVDLELNLDDKPPR